ncbi:MAG: ParB N-terminal domain-containing protein [Verrucomicrobiota bacterium]
MSLAIHCDHTELVEISQLVRNPRNPRKHPEDQIRLFARILQENGIRRPVRVSNRSGYITSGHGLTEALELLGETHAPVDRQDYANEAEELADLSADNRLAELAEDDEAQLIQLAEELLLMRSDHDPIASGYTETELADILALAEQGGEEEDPEPKPDPPSHGSLLDLIAKSAQIDADEIHDYTVKVTSQKPLVWKVERAKRVIKLMAG